MGFDSRFPSDDLVGIGIHMSLRKIDIVAYGLRLLSIWRFDKINKIKIIED